MKLRYIIITLCMFGMIAAGCAKKIDLEARRQELLRLNEQMRTAHLTGDAGAIIAIQAYPYTKVNAGRVSHPTEEENIERFQNYMSSMKLTAWDDLSDPIITLSDDATLATVIYRKHLSMKPAGQPDAEPMEGIFAWQSTYKRTPEGWKQISDILTVLPEDQMIEELKAAGR